MQIIIIPDFKKRIVSVALLIGLWISMITVADFIHSNNTLLNISLNDNLYFSYPISMKIDNIYVSEKIGNNGIKTVSLFSTPQVEVLKTIEAKGLGFSFSFPSAFQVNEQSFEGNEILYHVDFSNKNRDIHGFVQVWNLEVPLKEFLLNSKKTSPGNYKDFKMTDLKTDEANGYLWDYVSINENSSVKAMEAFFQRDNKMYRVSYFLPEKSFTKEDKKIFMDIINSLKFR